MGLIIIHTIPFTHDEKQFYIKVFEDREQFGYLVQAFYEDNSPVFKRRYSVLYETHNDMLNYTGDNAMQRLIDMVKEDVSNLWPE